MSGNAHVVLSGARRPCFRIVRALFRSSIYRSKVQRAFTSRLPGFSMITS